jgi:SAM-dependent methyltransferase
LSQLTFDAAAAKAIEAIYMTPDAVAQRARVIDLLAPAPGERVLDVGVGPGLLALDLARLVGESGRLVGLDRAPAMVAAASARLAGLPQAEVRIGDAANLDLPEGAFDAAVSTQVYEYVADMPRALAEHPPDASAWGPRRDPRHRLAKSRLALFRSGPYGPDAGVLG